MRGFILSCTVSMGLGACAGSTPPPERFPEMGRMQPPDGVFLKDDPKSQRSCKGDRDCGLGGLCYPGLQVCYSSFPNPGMIDVSFANPTIAGQCRPLNVYFPFDSAELVAEARQWLDYNRRCFKARGAKRVIVEAHCDSRGDDAYNVALSRRRGEAVKAHLAEIGLDLPIEIVARGKTEPIKEGATEQDYAWNRRVEFRFE